MVSSYFTLYTRNMEDMGNMEDIGNMEDMENID
jgi:spore coat protein CotH